MKGCRVGKWAGGNGSRGHKNTRQHTAESGESDLDFLLIPTPPSRRRTEPFLPPQPAWAGAGYWLLFSESLCSLEFWKILISVWASSAAASRDMRSIW